MGPMMLKRWSSSRCQLQWTEPGVTPEDVPPKMLEVDLDIESWQLWDRHASPMQWLCPPGAWEGAVPAVCGLIRREVWQPWNTRMCKAGRACFVVLVCISLIISWIFLLIPKVNVSRNAFSCDLSILIRISLSIETCSCVQPRGVSQKTPGVPNSQVVENTGSLKYEQLDCLTPRRLPRKLKKRRTVPKFSHHFPNFQYSVRRTPHGSGVLFRVSDLRWSLESRRLPKHRRAKAIDHGRWLNISRNTDLPWLIITYY